MLDGRNPKNSKATLTRDIIIGAVTYQLLKSSAIKVAPQMATKRMTKYEGKGTTLVCTHIPQNRGLCTP